MAKLLVVDDENDFVGLLKTRLMSQGFDVITAENGKQGYRMTVEQKPDLLITDVLMPEMSGYDMMQKIRAEEDEIHNVPIIIMSARQSMQQMFEDTDARCFLSKPFEASDLLTAVNAILSTLEKTAPPPTEVQAPSQQDAVVLAGVEEFVLLKVKNLLESLGFTVTQVHSEESAVEQTAAIMPGFVVVQFWENDEIFDAGKLYRGILENKNTKTIPFVAFCKESLGIDAMQVLPRESIITFDQSKDLLDKLAAWVQKQVRKNAN